MASIGAIIQEDQRIGCVVPHAHSERTLVRFCYQW